MREIKEETNIDIEKQIYLGKLDSNFYAYKK
jgi:8-oxo-dGTP pyrophosphatase MutT (NUDIX family)